MTRITAISDTHNKHKQVDLQPGDILIHAGDATGMGRSREIADFGKWLARQSFTHKVFVPGNHDLMFQSDPERAAQLVGDGANGVKVLVDSLVEVEGLRIYGTPWTPTFGHWAFMADDSLGGLAQRFQKIPGGLDFLICHGPPRGVLDRNLEGDLCGSIYLRKAVEEKKPKRMICGHIHEGYGSQLLGNTVVINVSSCTRQHRPTNPPTILEV